MLSDLLERHGCVIWHRSTAAAPGARKRIGDPSLAAPSPQHVLDLLAACPCTEDRFHDRHDIVAWLCGVKAAFGGCADQYWPEVLTWFLQYPGAEEEYFLKIWDSIEDAAVGWDWLDATSGAGIGAQVEFDDAPEDDAYPLPPERVATESMLSRYLYVRKQNRFWDTLKREEATATALCSEMTRIAPYGAAGVRAADSLFLNNPAARKHASFTYRPGEGLIVDDEVNTWRPSNMVPDSGDAGPWLRHVALLLPDPVQARHFLDWCAYVVQFPGRKISHALVLCTHDQGAGKDTALSPLREAVGRHNYILTSPGALCGTFTGFLEGQIIYVPEMKNYTKGEVYNNLKMWLARPPETVSVRKMRMDAYEIPNTQNWIFLTNADDAIGLEQDDRRLWVGNCVGVPRADTAYYDALWGWLNNGGREIAVGHLLARDLGGFRPFDAPMTAAKQDMIDLATPQSVQWLEEQFHPGGAFCGRTVIGTFEIRDACDDGWSTQPLRDVQITRVLQKHAFRKMPGKYSIDGKMRNVWTTLSVDLVAQAGLVGDRIKADRAKQRGA